MNARRLLLFSLLVLSCLASPGRAAEQTIAVSTVRLQLRNGNVKAELFEKAEARKHPVVLVLHGAGGTLLDGPEMRRVARALAENGNAVYLIHYFDRTGTLVALDSTMQRQFRLWLETVRDSIGAVQKTRGDSSPVGLYGYSLGAFLALFAASDNAQVGAVVEQAGGAWNGKMEMIRRMPPVLMVHGRRDGRVPFEQYAAPLLPVLRRHAPTVETRFFADEGHGFTPAAMGQVRAAAVNFFRHHLRGR